MRLSSTALLLAVSYLALTARADARHLRSDAHQDALPVVPFDNTTERLLQLGETILCQVVKLEVQYADGSDDGASYVCVTDNPVTGAEDQAYDMKVTPAVAQALNKSNGIAPTYVAVQNAVIAHNSQLVVADPIADMSVATNHGRRHHRALASTPTGTKKTLVLRVVHRGVQPTITRQQLAGRVFGLGNFPVAVNLADQMAACSFDKIKFVPASGPGIVYGVANLFIDNILSGDNTARDLDNLVVAYGNQRFGKLSDQYDHVIVVLPAGVLVSGKSWLAYGYLNSWRTVFSNEWAGRISALAHEMGHNLNLHHSGEGSEEYGDRSGYMGYGVFKVNYPAECFNAQNNWILGWYKDRAVALGLGDLPYSGNLAFFGDYDHTPADYVVLIKIGSGNPRLYLQLNTAVDMNRGTRARKNQVVIVRDDGSAAAGLISWVEGGIGWNIDGVSPVHRRSNFQGTGRDLVIEVCGDLSGYLDAVKISIWLDDGVQHSTCRAAVPSPTSVCEDNKDALLVVSTSGNYRTCAWLGRYFDIWGPKLCVQGSEWYDECPEMCGQCTDDCNDSATATFFVTPAQGVKNCAWLANNYGFQDLVCVPGHDAYRYCHESCDRC